MCLLKPGQQNSHCGHEECKNFYLLRNKSCLYDTNNKTQSDSNANKISAKLFQISSASPTQDPSVPSRTSPINMKRTSTPKSETSTDGEAESSICTKKVKFEGKTINPETIVLTPPTSDRPNVSQNIFPSFFGQPNLQAILPNSTFGNLFNNSSLLAQFPQGNQLNIPQGIDNFLPNFQYNLNPIALQSLLQAQAESLKPESVIQPQLNKKPVKSAFVEQVMDFQAKTLTFLENQNKMLIDLGEKNELIQETLACLISEITSLKKSVLSGNIGGIERAVPALEKSASSVQQPISNTGEPIDADELVNYLYGNGKQDFEYRLVLSTEFSLPLYRERNFGFTINLVDKDGNIVENSNRLPVAISLYTCENPPKYIDSNTAGNKILKGFAEKDIVQGAVSFDKIQIKEVTSHFRNGWIFIVVHPKSNNTQNSNVFMERNGVCVDATKIKPLVLEKVIVKAKKTKEKDQ